MNAKKILAIAALVAVAIGCCLSGGARTPKWDDGEASRRAAYLYLEAQRRYSLDDLDSYYDLLQQAYALDTADAYVGFELGYYQFRLANDSAGMARSYDRMRRYFLSNPADYYGALTYVDIAHDYGQLEEAARVWGTIDSMRPGTPEYASLYAKALAEIGHPDSLRKAIAVLTDIEEKQGQSLHWSASKMAVYLRMDDTASVFNEMRRLIATAPADPDYLLMMGELQQAYGDIDSTAYYFDRACEADSTCGRAIYRRAAFYEERGDSAAFDAEIMRALRLPSLDIEDKINILHTYVSQLYNDSTRQPQIQALFDLLIDQHPHEKDLHKLYAGYLMAVDDLPEALAQIVSQLELDPDDEQSWGLASSLSAQLGDYEQSLGYATKGLEYFPDALGLNRLAAYSLVGLKRYDEALEFANKAPAKASDPRDAATIYNLLGDIYYRLGDLEKMSESMSAAIKANPSDLTTLNNYAYFLTEMDGDLRRAEMMSRECVLVEPDNPTYLDTYAWVLYKLGDLEGALEYINKAIEHEPVEEESEEISEHAAEIKAAIEKAANPDNSH